VRGSRGTTNRFKPEVIHREEGQLMRCPPAQRPLVPPQDLPDPELFPQSSRDVDAPERAGPLDLGTMMVGRRSETRRRTPSR
jgi:hypothetical protein